MSSLLFIYNAKSGFVNSVIVVSHKLLSPDTYSCNLCTITHDTFTENKLWKDFRLTSKIDMLFYHIDEFEQRYPNQTFKLPIILSKKDNSLNAFISSEEINLLKNVEDLIKVITERSVNYF